MQAYEKCGSFYLGRLYDQKSRSILEDPLLYDAKDLTTHGLCVGMTGSGKTGLSLSILEEAVIDGIPAIAIDPKGDLGNIMLSFPELSATAFRPWIDEHEANRKGLKPDAYAKEVALSWKKGLAQWGQDASRVRRLKKAAEVTIYTPGSTTGVPLTLLRSFQVPSQDILDDAEALQDQILSTASGLLALLGIKSHSLRSKECILISMIFDHHWKSGNTLTLPDLIHEIQSPPFEKVGVVDLESFYSKQDRHELSMHINCIIASPKCSLWFQGEPLNIEQLMYTQDGRPRIAILSVSHLSDEERMFFITIFLNALTTWIRSQPGTSSLRSLLFMDEIHGYFPPSAMPPTKKPMLSLLKQARAYGLGILLATQNPVDLDYKGLSNTGTWFIDRLQTSRDKDRLLDGLEGASLAQGKQLNRAAIDKLLSGLSSRVFLMHNVHEDEPQIFHSRWALCYLRGPLTRSHIQQLMKPQKRLLEKSAATASEQSSPLTHVVSSSTKRSTCNKQKPLLPPGIKDSYLTIVQTLDSSLIALYKPTLFGIVKLHYVNARANIDTWSHLYVLNAFPTGKGTMNWRKACMQENAGWDLQFEPETENISYASLPSCALHKKNYTTWKKELISYIYQTKPIRLWKSTTLKSISKVGESEGAFRGRLALQAREARDLQVEKLRNKFARRLMAIQDRMRRAEQRVEKESEQYKHQKMQTFISIGASLIGALFGRKTSKYRHIGRATTAVRGAGRATRERGDIKRAEEELASQQNKLIELEEQLELEIEKITESMDPTQLNLQKICISPRKSDILFDHFGLTWTPWGRVADGSEEALFHAEELLPTWQPEPS